MNINKVEIQRNAFRSNTVIHMHSQSFASEV